jgi:hypothetical protein
VGVDLLNSSVGRLELVCKIKNRGLYTGCDLDNAMCNMRLDEGKKEEKDEGRKGLTRALSDGDAALYSLLRTKFCLSYYV